jgi:hemerythrin-like metal-binding protein
MLAGKAMHTATQTFRWSEAYSVHIAILDEQHRRLVATLNELNQALRSGMGASVMDSVLGKLMEYATEHFESEETLMEQHHFPGLSTHRHQHEEFQHKMAVFMEAHHAGKPCVPVSVMLYMEKWLKEHLVKTDQLYSAYLNARGVY